jgi:hypothetical protein
MTLAIRMTMVDASPNTVRNLVSTLLEQADEAVVSSTVNPLVTHDHLRLSVTLSTANLGWAAIGVTMFRSKGLF